MKMIDRAARAAQGAVSRAVNPGGLSDEVALRQAVAGKVVLVTGASYGLGEATARKLGAAGATVLAVARTVERLNEVVAQITAAGGTAQAYAADLTDEVAVEKLVARVLEQHGGVDVIVNNAGKSMRRSLDLQYDRFHDFTRMMRINYLGPVRLLLGLLPSMKERGGGHIVNVSTIGVRIAPGPRWGVYQSSKGAFDIWLRSVTPELAQHGITVSTIYMALMYTRMSAPTPRMNRLPGLHADEAAELVAKAIAAKRDIAPWWIRPAEFASVVTRGPVARLMTLVLRASADSDSALGAAPLPSEHSRARGAK